MHLISKEKLIIGLKLQLMKNTTNTTNLKYKNGSEISSA